MFLAAFWPLTAPAHTYAAFMRWFCGQRGWAGKKGRPSGRGLAELDENLKMPGKANIFQWDFLFYFLPQPSTQYTFFTSFIFVFAMVKIFCRWPWTGRWVAAAVLVFFFSSPAFQFGPLLFLHVSRGIEKGSHTHTHELCSCSRCGF